MCLVTSKSWMFEDFLGFQGFLRVTGSFESSRRFERVLKVFLGFWMVQGVSEDLGGFWGRGVRRFWQHFDIKKFNFGGAISYHISHFIILLYY